MVRFVHCEVGTLTKFVFHNIRFKVNNRLSAESHFSRDISMIKIYSPIVLMRTKYKKVFHSIRFNVNKGLPLGGGAFYAHR